MSDLKLFQIEAGDARELVGHGESLERHLQTLIESNLETLLGIRFLASEHSTGPKHGGRIDTLGLDENGTPVILEYKRNKNENVINQGLFYLDWLLDHQADFKLLVMDRLGKEAADTIDWSGPRLVCIAGDFTRYDEHAIQQMDHTIALIRYRRFGDGLLLLEQLNATDGDTGLTQGAGRAQAAVKTVSQFRDEAPEALRELYEELETYLRSLGDDVQIKVLKHYIAFKRLKNFACVEIHPSKGCLYVYTKVDPDAVSLEEGFTRDVRDVGHYGTGGLEITLRTLDDLRRAHDLLLQSYEAS